MKYGKYKLKAGKAIAEIGSFETDGKIAEHHVLIHVVETTLRFEEQKEILFEAFKELMSEHLAKGTRPIFKRYFMSDVTNQAGSVMAAEEALPGIWRCTASCIGQPPLDGCKISLWVYCVSGVEAINDTYPLTAGRQPLQPERTGMPGCQDSGETVGMLSPNVMETSFRHNGYTHLWSGGLEYGYGDSANQTMYLLNAYEEHLCDTGATLEENCVRTWFFVQNVDVNYAGVVTARKANFIEHGLTEKTHYIASTGIEGKSADARTLVHLDTYSVKGLVQGQQQYLYAPTHLNPTYEYGVTFERGVRIKYGDRSHIYISGTASIDNKGKVLYEGDIEAQTRRMWENVETLLAEGGATFSNVAQMLIYLRDVADCKIVREMFDRKFPLIPKEYLLAPVCRPAWLIEMECVALTEETNPEYRDL